MNYDSIPQYLAYWYILYKLKSRLFQVSPTVTTKQKLSHDRSESRKLMSDWWFQVTMESSHQSHLTRESRSNTIGSAPVHNKKPRVMGLIYNYLKNLLFLAFYYLDNLHLAFKHLLKKRCRCFGNNYLCYKYSISQNELQ